MPDQVPAELLEEMIAYYSARAPEYEQWWERGRIERGEQNNQGWRDERELVYKAFDELNLTGRVLELAPGTGIWTRRLVRTADSITAVDASAEMIAMNRGSVASDKVRYVQADLFAWEPAETYDAVVFNFWVSHVPLERLQGFFDKVARALRVDGRVFFVDGFPDASMASLTQESEQVITRKLNDGREFRIVKNYYQPAMLEDLCRRAGLEVKVDTTPTYFYYGIGKRITRG